MSNVYSVKVRKQDGKIVELPLAANVKDITWNSNMNLKQAIGDYPYKVYNTVQEMKNDAFYLSPGRCVKTLGYYNRGDGGGAEYIIDVTTAPFSIYLNKTLRANMIIPSNGVVNALQYGIKNDGTGYPSLMKEFLQHNKFVHALYFPRGIYTLPNENFTLEGDVKIIGDGCDTIIQCQYAHKITISGNAIIENFSLLGGCDFYSTDPSRFKFKLDIYRK